MKKVTSAAVTSAAVNQATLEYSDSLTECARHHIKKVYTLAEKALNKKYELPCECKKVALKNFLDDYECEACSEIFYYSFCIGEVVYANDTWHCSLCGDCREASEWHCKYCNQCTYGVTLPCENCDRKSPYMP